MASDPRVPGAGVFGDLPPSYTRSPPAVNSDLLRRPSYCHAAVALKQISKVTHLFIWIFLVTISVIIVLLSHFNTSSESFTSRFHYSYLPLMQGKTNN